MKIDGIKNLKLPLAAEVEVKAGSSYQKKIYHGLPLLFGVGAPRNRRYGSNHLAERPDSERDEAGGR